MKPRARQIWSLFRDRTIDGWTVGIDHGSLVWEPVEDSPLRIHLTPDIHMDGYLSADVSSDALPVSHEDRRYGSRTLAREYEKFLRELIATANASVGALSESRRALGRRAGLIREQNSGRFDVGDHVMGGSIPADFDHGRIVSLDGDRALVAWEWSGDKVEVPLDGLEYYDADTEARMRDLLK